MITIEYIFVQSAKDELCLFRNSVIPHFTNSQAVVN